MVTLHRSTGLEDLRTVDTFVAIATHLQGAKWFLVNFHHARETGRSPSHLRRLYFSI